MSHGIYSRQNTGPTRNILSTYVVIIQRNHKEMALQRNGNKYELFKHWKVLQGKYVRVFCFSFSFLSQNIGKKLMVIQCRCWFAFFFLFFFFQRLPKWRPSMMWRYQATDGSLAHLSFVQPEKVNLKGEKLNPNLVYVHLGWLYFLWNTTWQLPIISKIS